MGNTPQLPVQKNQFRLYLHCAAYVILHSFQADMLAGTELECSPITTMREKLLLSAVYIDEKKHCCAPHLKNRAILCLLTIFECCLQAHRTDFDVKSVWLRENPN